MGIRIKVMRIRNPGTYAGLVMEQFVMEIEFKNLVRMSVTSIVCFQGRIFARGNAPSGSASEQNPCTTRVFVSTG
jgi:hypothetical protein